MQNNIIFFQSSSIGGIKDQVGLLDLLITHVTGVPDLDLFEQLQVIVPNQAQAIWLKDQLTLRQGICANLDFVVLLGPVLQNIYQANNPDVEFYDFNQAKFLIYSLLCAERINCADADELNNYIYAADGSLDRLKAFQLASQLQSIFHEYLYLRTVELINLERANFKTWQKILWRKLLVALNEKKTFLDIYRYFAEIDLEGVDLKLPRQLFIFGLTSLYPSQLEIILKLSSKINVYWYYQPCSHQYYGDLLSSKARAKIEQRLLRKPDLSLDDLYLNDGNPLLANLGQQSRELIELLRANDVQVYDFNPAEFNPSQVSVPQTILEIIQDDIRQIKYRIRPEYRVHAKSDYYADPLNLAQSTPEAIYDLPAQQLSLKINVAHNRMREVQVMFNEVVAILDKNPTTKLSDILITAPDIDDYAAYLSAVLDNESLTKADGTTYKLLYNLTGNRRHKSYKILETLQLILNAPYQLNVSYLLEILMQAELQTNLDLSNEDILLIKRWLADNHTHFGYSAADYARYGYQNYSVHSFKQLLTNLVLGACLNTQILSAESGLPLYHGFGADYVPYDNLDNAQISLANKLIDLIELLELLRTKFYQDVDNYRELKLAEVYALFSSIQERLINDDEALLTSNKFSATLLQQDQELVLNLPMLNLLLTEYMANLNSKLNLNGRICCASMQYMRNLPFKHVYVLGLNFGEFPSSFRPNQLSLLANEWYLADRNYNSEDKQAFLDTILAARQQLILSYIGRKETDNSAIKPSPVLNLLINTLGQSFSNFWQGDDLIQQKFDFRNLLNYHSLHPFYNNLQPSYSQIWQQIALKSSSDGFNDQRWNFAQLSTIKLTPEQEQKYFNLNLKSLSALFLYTNANLYKTLGISNFENEIELADVESLVLTDGALAKQLGICFEKYSPALNLSLLNPAPNEPNQPNSAALCEFLQLKGVLAYQHIGQWQFEHYWQFYQVYLHARGAEELELKFNYILQRGDGSELALEFADKVWREGNQIIVMDDFARLCNAKLADKLGEVNYALRIRGLLICLLLAESQKDAAQPIIEQVLIRQVNLANERREFIITVDEPANLLRRVLSYYVRSLTNPVLVHKAAINEYAKASVDCWKNGALKNTPQQCLAKAETVYRADWQNYDLDRIKSDPIFAALGADYFEVIARNNGVNDIAQFGNILSQLRG